MRLQAKEQRVLDFDLECRPIAWYGGDWVTKQPTAIAWKFVGEDGPVQCANIGDSLDSRNVYDEEVEMLEAFRWAYDQADVVTGHFIRGFDLPLINGRLMRHGRPMLAPKLAQDTKGDLATAHGMSKSQENLGAMFETAHPKVGMNTTLWEDANVLLPSGIAATRKRVIGDVEQHIELRAAMLDGGYLAAPRLWSPIGAVSEQYTP